MSKGVNVPKLGKLSSKMEERLLSLIKEEGVPINDAPSKKKVSPSAKKRGGKPTVATVEISPAAKARTPSYSKSLIWAIQRPFEDKDGLVRWETIAMCTDDAVGYYLSRVTGKCRKQQLVVWGEDYADKKEEIDADIQKQLELKIEPTGGNTESPVNGGEGKI